MSNRGELVPTRVVDKNGRMMTVHKRASSLSGKRAPIPAIKVPESDSIEAIVGSYIKRLKDRSVVLSGKDMNIPLYKMTQEQLRLSADLISKPHAGRFMPFLIEGHMGPLESAAATAWLEVMNRQFSSVMRSGLLHGNEFDEQRASSFIGALPHIQYSYYHRMGVKHADYMALKDDYQFTPDQEFNILMLNLGCWGSDLEGRRKESNGMYGPTSELENAELVDFAVRSTREEVARACLLIQKGGVTRVSQLEAILSNDVVAPVAGGWL